MVEYYIGFMISLIAASKVLVRLVMVMRNIIAIGMVRYYLATRLVS
jgi:hypothetical protein